MNKFGSLLVLILISIDLIAGDSSLSKHSGRIFITRHGQRAKIAPPDYDPPLTADGRKQAHLVAEELIRRGFKGVIYSSPYRRTLETASIIAGKTGSVICLAPLAQEYARHPGKPRTLARPLRELKKEFPLISTTHLPDDWMIRGPESFLAVKERVHKMLAAMPPKPLKQDWLFVTHGAVIKGFHLLCVNYQGGKEPELPVSWNCCLSEYLFLPGGKLKTVSLFDVSFIPDDLITSNYRRKIPAK